MNAGIDILFDEFAARHARGEHPDARNYLERAGESRDELARLLDGFLAAAPVQPPTEDTLATFAELVPDAGDTPPMLAARVRMGLPRADVVRKLTEFLGLRPESDKKVASYYHELETGLLDPRGVEPLVWQHLAKIFGTGIRGLMVHPWEPPPVLVASYYRRSDNLVSAAPVAPPSEGVSESRELDEVDRLFTGNA